MEVLDLDVEKTVVRGTEKQTLWGLLLRGEDAASAALHLLTDLGASEKFSSRCLLSPHSGLPLCGEVVLSSAGAIFPFCSFHVIRRSVEHT